MIRTIEIKETARDYGVPETTIEKDYALSWILNALNQQTDLIALKGGTGIRKVYFENFRFSEDLDFTMLKSMDQAELERIIKSTIQTVKRDSGINFYDDIQFKENLNGYEIDVYFRILRQIGNPLRIKLDLTKPEKEKVILPLDKKHILHPYSDNYSTTVLVYSIQEIVAEKMRSTFERTRPRDLYDIWYISKKWILNRLRRSSQRSVSLKMLNRILNLLLNEKTILPEHGKIRCGIN